MAIGRTVSGKSVSASLGSYVNHINGVLLASVQTRTPPIYKKTDIPRTIPESILETCSRDGLPFTQCRYVGNNYTAAQGRHWQRPEGKKVSLMAEGKKAYHALGGLASHTSVLFAVNLPLRPGLSHA